MGVRVELNGVGAVQGLFNGGGAVRALGGGRSGWGQGSEMGLCVGRGLR